MSSRAEDAARKEHALWVIAQLTDIDNVIASGRVDMGRQMLCSFIAELEARVIKEWPNVNG